MNPSRGIAIALPQQLTATAQSSSVVQQFPAGVKLH
jgi:hypothetical protein